MADFIEWLSEIVEPYSDKMTRAKWIYSFMEEFIFPKLTHTGYELAINKEELRSKLATWMFTVDCEYRASFAPTLRLPAAKHKGLLRDWEDFLHVFSDRCWAEVRRKMPHGETFFREQLAADYFYSNLSYFLYRFLSVDKSIAIQLANRREKELEEEEKEYLISEGLWVEEKRGRNEEDSYYRDAGIFRGDRRYDI